MNCNTSQFLKLEVPGMNTAIAVDCFVRTYTRSVCLFNGDLVVGESSEVSGSDACGSYRAVSTMLTCNDAPTAILEFRYYRDSSVVLGLLHYCQDTPVRPESALGITLMNFDDFVRGVGSYMYTDSGYPYLWARPFFSDSFGSLPERSCYYLWENSNGLYAAMIPLCGGGMRSFLQPNKEEYGFGVTVAAGSGAAEHIPSTVPMFVLSIDDDPFAATQSAYRAGLAAMGEKARLRHEKSYPEIFNYIGWCSWNTYYQGVNQQKIVDTVRSFKEAEFPIGWLLVDDGWLDVKDTKLLSFDADPDKFPSGLGGLVSLLKSDYGVRWVGVWHAFTGYWNGVDPDGDDFQADKTMLAYMPNAEHLPIISFGPELPKGIWIPSPYDDGAYGFFSSFHSRLKSECVDFVKVDNQSSLVRQIGGQIPIESAMHSLQSGLQRSVAENFKDAVINCMSMSPDALYEWSDSNIGRVSNDYFPGRPTDSQIHISDSVYNSLYWSQICWPDYDMFESHHVDAKLHAMARALSGGPVYFTDTPGREDWDVLRGLIFSDGRLAKPDQPALPTRDCLFVDPRREATALKVWNYSRGVGIIGCFNVHIGPDRTSVHTTIRASDVEGLSGESFAIYDQSNGDLFVLNRYDSLPVQVEYNGARIFIVSPIESGFAAIGAPEKYICPSVIKSSAVEAGLIKIKLRDGGRFVAYSVCAPESIRINGESLPKSSYSYTDNLIGINITGHSETDVEIHLRA
ncbi:MAG: Sip1-related alpha-galactosidase [Armatimonadota bacterium]